MSTARLRALWTVTEICSPHF